MNSKYFSFILLGALLTAACTTDDDDLPGELVPDIDLTDEGLVPSRQAQERMTSQFVTDLYRSYGVGYGYDATGKYCSYDDVRGRIIDLQAVYGYDREHGTSLLVEDLAPHAYQHIYSGIDAYTLCKQLTANATVSTEYVLFQGEMTGDYSRTDIKSRELSFCTIHSGLALAARHLEPYDLAEVVKENPSLLSPAFLRYQQLADACLKDGNNEQASLYLRQMMQNYGTHFIYDAQLGGMIKYNCTIDRNIVDSRTSMSTHGEASFFWSIGTATDDNRSNWFRNTETHRKTRITAYGGDSKCILDMYDLNGLSSAGESASDAEFTKRAQIVDNWYKSLKIEGENSNIELVDMKVIPIIDLIIYPRVATFYATLTGQYIHERESVTPRVRNRINVRISVDDLYAPSYTVMLNIKAGGEVIGEVVNEFFNKKLFHVFYPVLAGRVQHEGIAVRTGESQVYLVTWNYTQTESESTATITPVPYSHSLKEIFYNDGSVDTAPADTGTLYIADYSKDAITVTSWNDAFQTGVKIGPYLLQQGCMASILNNEQGNTIMNSYKTLSKDVPYGYEIVSLEKMKEIMKYMYKPENPLLNINAEVHAFFRGKNFIFESKEDNSLRVYQILKDKNEPVKRDDFSMGLILLKRRSDYVYP